MSHPLVVNMNRFEPYDVYIGRPGPWGNQFWIGTDGTRAQVIAKHREMVLGDEVLRGFIKLALRGKRLGCHCAPRACHGDVLAEIANEEEE